MSHQITIVFVIYFAIIYLIGFIASKRAKSSAGYLLGNRSFNPYVTALSAGASDMSGWLLLALPGAVYVAGLNHIWIAVGLLIGAYCNWLFVAKRLRLASFHANNALTIPEYLRVRFEDNKDVIGLAVAVISLIFFSFYAASGFVAFAKLFSNLYAIHYSTALIFAVIITTVYILIGGFTAVNWVDVFQGLLVLAALLVLPILMLVKIGGVDQLSYIVHHHPNHFNIFHGMSIVSMVSLLGWGLGYFGQPHILVRFMAAKRPDSMPVSRRIGILWMFLCLFGAISVGILGFALFSPSVVHKPEEIFLIATNTLVQPTFAGILMAAVLSAIISTSSAQMLISSSALIEDILLKFFPQQISDHCEVLLDKAGVVIVAMIAMILAYNPNSSILKLVSYAWAGLGATLGPAILLSLYWRRTTKAGVIVGLLVGTLFAIIWPELSGIGGIFAVWAVVPGFFGSMLSIYLVSLFTRPPEKVDLFE